MEGGFFFGYTWMNMDFTVLGRTPKGVQVCMRVVLKRRRSTHRKGKGDGRKRGDWEQGSGKELEQDMIRLSLVINLSEAVRTCFKSPKFTFQKLPPNPQTHCPCLGAIVKVYAQKLKQKIKKEPGPCNPKTNPKCCTFFFTHRINIGI